MKVDLETRKSKRVIYKFIIILISFLFQFFIISLSLSCHPNNFLYTFLLFIIYIYLNILVLAKFFDNQDKKYKFLIKEHIGLFILALFLLTGEIAGKQPTDFTMLLGRFSFWVIPIFTFLKFHRKRNPGIKAITKVRLVGGVMMLLGIAAILLYSGIKKTVGEGFIWFFLEGSIVWTFLGILLRNNICRIITIIYSIVGLILMITSIIITRGNYPARFLVIFILLIILIRLLTRKDIKKEFIKKSHSK